MAVKLSTVKVAHYKKTAQQETRVLPMPKKLVIPMIQHIGRPCELAVKVGDSVLKGQVIGEAKEFLCAPIHAPTSGKVTAIHDVLTASGVYTPAVEITPDGEDTPIETQPIKVETLDDLVAASRQIGLVGLGGAGFPTHVKFKPKNLDDVDTLIVNATECEPFITADHREMMENAQDVAEGTALIAKLMGLKKAIIGIENNKPEAIKLMRQIANGRYEVKELKSTYPQGAEKVIIYHCTGRRVMEGQLPSDVGVVVLNVTSVGCLMRGIKTGMPLTHKRVTVSGDCVKQPSNVYAPIGTQISELIEFCGGVVGDAGKLIMGGPMMGTSTYSMDLPLLKNSNAILLLSKELGITPDPTSCIRCGKCMEACPLYLMPTVFEHAYEQGDLELLNKQKIMLCMECGCCSFVCPAKRPLVQINRLAKQAVRAGKK